MLYVNLLNSETCILLISISIQLLAFQNYKSIIIVKKYNYNIVMVKSYQTCGAKPCHRAASPYGNEHCPSMLHPNLLRNLCHYRADQDISNAPHVPYSRNKRSHCRLLFSRTPKLEYNNGRNRHERERNKEHGCTHSYELWIVNEVLTRFSFNKSNV